MHRVSPACLRVAGCRGGAAGGARSGALLRSGSRPFLGASERVSACGAATRRCACAVPARCRGAGAWFAARGVHLGGRSGSIPCTVRAVERACPAPLLVAWYIACWPCRVCVARRHAFGQALTSAERKGSATERAAVLAWCAAWSFFPGEPAPGCLAYGLVAPARPCGVFRELSRPMSDSKPRRGDARRQTRDPASAGSSKAACSTQRGVSTPAQ